MTGRRVDQLVSTLQRVLVPPVRPNPLVVMWRWRYELIAICTAVLVVIGLPRAGTAGTVVAGAAALTAIVVLARWPAGRRRVAARAWCVVTPHRIRAACAQARVYSTRGRLPAVLCCAPRHYGEWVLLWLPAGVTVGDLRAGRDVIATACYASDVRVVPHPRYRHIVALEVIRR